MIIGTPYLDLGGNSVIRNCATGDYCEFEYHKRGWSSTNSYKVDGEVYNAKKELIFKIEGKWSEKGVIINAKNGNKEEIWHKTPYPENADYMYGMSHFMV